MVGGCDRGIPELGHFPLGPRVADAAHPPPGLTWEPKAAGQRETRVVTQTWLRGERCTASCVAPAGGSPQRKKEKESVSSGGGRGQ